ncbi:hypothetical protein [Streptomyces sp. NPDC090036]|uniref:hypothetical protein n=1 Tax=Streptomyces sp. NPDC090036 TaxID=3365926 RepID=UPI003805E2CA
MDLEQLRATCEARAESLRLPHRFSTRDLRDAVAEQRGRPITRRPLSTLGAKHAPCGIRLETPAGLLLDGDEAPPAAGTRSRKGDLPPETAWLLLVWDAHARGPVRENAGAAS